jgi:hypothetical protein
LLVESVHFGIQIKREGKKTKERRIIASRTLTFFLDIKTSTVIFSLQKIPSEEYQKKPSAEPKSFLHNKISLQVFTHAFHYFSLDSYLDHPFEIMKSIFLTSALLCAHAADSFQVAPQVGKLTPAYTKTVSSLASKKGSADADVEQHAYPVGTFIEFEEKSREHIGKIEKAEHKSSGRARYQVVDDAGKHFDIADKAITFAINAPNSPAASEKLFGEFVAAHDSTEASIQSQLDINSELLEMAWEESGEMEDHLLTPAALIDLVHSHAASAIEKYMAWKLLRTDVSHVFFKEIKDHGRVVSFKGKARKAVEAAKQAFCNSHEDSDICLV